MDANIERRQRPKHGIGKNPNINCLWPGNPNGAPDKRASFAIKELAAPIKKGAILGRILDAKTLKTHFVRAPASGHLYRYGCLRVDAHDLDEGGCENIPFPELILLRVLQRSGWLN